MSELSTQLPRPLSIPQAGIKKAMNFIIIAVGCLMALTFFFVVILRYIFHADLFAYEEWLMVAAFWMFFCAAAMATHDGAHINADILGFMIADPKWIWRRAVLVSALELVVLCVLTYWGYLMIAEEFAVYPKWQATIALRIPFVVPRFAIFFGFLMMTVFNLLHLYVLLKQGPASSTHGIERDDSK